MRRPNPILALLAVLACVASSQPSSFEPSAGVQERRVKWTSKTIQIALSTSLLSPSPAIQPDSDVVGAIERALRSWSSVANITFVEVSSKAQSISPANRGDGISLITIASTPENLSIFGEENNPARTRVFYDPETGAISEADIVINPYPYSGDGASLQFSTDGTPGTYDLESTVAHELGHLLGLNHSHVIGSTMLANQGLNGTFGLPALTERTLSEVDRVAVRSIYGPRENSGSVEGRILNNVEGSLVPATGAHIWIEDIATGRVIASSLANANGRFRIDCVPPGDYRAMIEYLDGGAVDSLKPIAVIESRSGRRQRAFRSIEISSQLRVAADKIATLNYVLVSPQNSAPILNPRLIGFNGELSTVPVPAEVGKRLTIYIGGEGVDQIPGTGLLVSSPFITVNPGSLTLQQFHNSVPVVSFDVTVASNAPAGDYSIRLQSNSGEIAYLVGGITIDSTK
jgi:matrixin